MHVQLFIDVWLFKDTYKICTMKQHFLYNFDCIVSNAFYISSQFCNQVQLTPTSKESLIIRLYKSFTKCKLLHAFKTDNYN